MLVERDRIGTVIVGVGRVRIEPYLTDPLMDRFPTNAKVHIPGQEGQLFRQGFPRLNSVCIVPEQVGVRLTPQDTAAGRQAEQ